MPGGTGCEDAGVVAWGQFGWGCDKAMTDGAEESRVDGAVVGECRSGY